MAINVNIYNTGNAVSRSINIDFAGDFLAKSDGAYNDKRFYFKMTTNARDTDNNPYSARVVESLEDLALNKESKSKDQDINPYTNIKEMITDYIYDYINGHDAEKHDTSVTEQKPMRF